MVSAYQWLHDLDETSRRNMWAEMSFPERMALSNDLQAYYIGKGGTFPRDPLDGTRDPETGALRLSIRKVAIPMGGTGYYSTPPEDFGRTKTGLPPIPGLKPGSEIIGDISPWWWVLLAIGGAYLMTSE